MGLRGIPRIARGVICYDTGKVDEVVPSHAGVVVSRGASAFPLYSRGQVHQRQGLFALGTMGCAVSAAKEKKLLSMVWGRISVACLLGRGFGHPIWGIWPEGWFIAVKMFGETGRGVSEQC